MHHPLRASDSVSSASPDALTPSAPHIMQSAASSFAAPSASSLRGTPSLLRLRSGKLSAASAPLMPSIFRFHAVHARYTATSCWQPLLPVRLLLVCVFPPTSSVSTSYTAHVRLPGHSVSSPQHHRAFRHLSCYHGSDPKPGAHELSVSLPDYETHKSLPSRPPESLARNQPECGNLAPERRQRASSTSKRACEQHVCTVLNAPMLCTNDLSMPKALRRKHHRSVVLRRFYCCSASTIR